jgi:hypothetical protein
MNNETKRWRKRKAKYSEKWAEGASAAMEFAESARRNKMRQKLTGAGAWIEGEIK